MATVLETAEPEQKYPIILFDPEVKEIHDAEEALKELEESKIDVELQQIEEQTQELVSEERELGQEETPQGHTDSGNIDDLEITFAKFQENWNQAMYPNKATTKMEAREQREFKERFLNEAIPTFAFEAVAIINSLIEFDKWPRTQFGNFNEVYEQIKNNTLSPINKAHATRSLFAIARSATKKAESTIQQKFEVPIIGHYSGTIMSNLNTGENVEKHE